jgi:serine protease DegS
MPQIVRYLLIAAIAGAVLGLAVVAWIHRPASVTAGFADAVAAAEPSVVNIYSTKVVRTRLHPICDLPRFRELCEAANGASRRMQNSLGSGVVVRADGYILTNAHVIDDADEILVAFFDGQTAPAQIIGVDPETDLAVIRADATGLQPVQVGSSDEARVGDIVLAIGNPFGIGQTVSMGIVSAKGRYGLSTSPYEDFLQTDAAINPGNSGGALIDVRGRLLGINSLFYSQTGGSQGIGFAVPVKLALTVLEDIITEGRVIRGWLGIEVSNGAIPYDRNGLAIADVVPGSPAAKAGLLRGDVIIAINDLPATSARVVTRQISVSEPGSDIKLSVQRDGQRLEVHATAGVRPPPS